MHPHFLVGLYELFHERVLASLPGWCVRPWAILLMTVSLPLALPPSFSQLCSASSAGVGADVGLLWIRAFTDWILFLHFSKVCQSQEHLIGIAVNTRLGPRWVKVESVHEGTPLVAVKSVYNVSWDCGVPRTSGQHINKVREWKNAPFFLSSPFQVLFSSVCQELGSMCLCK